LEPTITGQSHERLHLGRLQFCTQILDKFCIDVTFEMRTVHHEICLFIDAHEIIREHYILNGNGGEESKIAETERERERVCVRQHMGEN
jgi:hypothetical protein